MFFFVGRGILHWFTQIDTFQPRIFCLGSGFSHDSFLHQLDIFKASHGSEHKLKYEKEPPPVWSTCFIFVKKLLVWWIHMSYTVVVDSTSLFIFFINVWCQKHQSLAFPTHSRHASAVSRTATYWAEASNKTWSYSFERPYVTRIPVLKRKMLQWNSVNKNTRKMYWPWKSENFEWSLRQKPLVFSKGVIFITCNSPKDCSFHGLWLPGLMYL